jgi:hypothetical protein
VRKHRERGEEKRQGDREGPGGREGGREGSLEDGLGGKRDSEGGKNVLLQISLRQK